ncbi:hypothetical protein FQN50_009497 [Emmonsiellopsis sp. PD_5]|nr:hypothetical protein FQN50_009497 [Emmonsiellopsis sp. PD_5]
MDNTDVPDPDGSASGRRPNNNRSPASGHHPNVTIARILDAAVARSPNTAPPHATIRPQPRRRHPNDLWVNIVTHARNTTPPNQNSPTNLQPPPRAATFSIQDAGGQLDMEPGEIAERNDPRFREGRRNAISRQINPDEWRIEVLDDQDATSVVDDPFDRTPEADAELFRGLLIVRLPALPAAYPRMEPDMAAEVAQRITRMIAPMRITLPSWDDDPVPWAEQPRSLSYNTDIFHPAPDLVLYEQAYWDLYRITHWNPNYPEERDPSIPLPEPCIEEIHDPITRLAYLRRMADSYTKIRLSDKLIFVSWAMARQVRYEITIITRKIVDTADRDALEELKRILTNAAGNSFNLERRARLMALYPSDAFQG